MKEEFKKKLSEEQLNILDKAGTEAPFSGKYVKFDKKGKFVYRLIKKLFI